MYGAAGTALQQDVTNYVAGINAYINEARINPLKMPGEYAAIGKPGPADWKVTDVIATASLIGGIFGKGGGRELDSALLLQQAPEALRQARRQARVGGPALRRGPGGARDRPRQALPVPGRAAQAARAAAWRMPDRGTVKRPEDLQLLEPAPRGRSLRRPPVGCPTRCSSRAASRRRATPIAVFGPQTAYYAPQLLMDVDVHGPGMDARGATFAGISLYVLLGHGRDYAWSATSAGQDIIDTYAVPLCEPDGSKPTVELVALPLPRPVPPHRRDGEDEQLDAERGRRHAARARRRSTPSAPTSAW